MNNNLKFYVADNENLPAEKAGTLYMLIMNQDKSYWFDNRNSEWQRSLFLPREIMTDPEFTPVKNFDNGYITIHDAIEYYEQRITIYDDPEM